MSGSSSSPETKTSPGYSAASSNVTGSETAKPQRTLTLEMRKMLSRKNGVAPRSVKSVIAMIHAKSVAVEKYPRRSCPTYSPRTTQKSSALQRRYDASTT